MEGVCRWHSTGREQSFVAASLFAAVAADGVVDAVVAESRGETGRFGVKFVVLSGSVLRCYKVEPNSIIHSDDDDDVAAAGSYAAVEVDDVVEVVVFDVVAVGSKAGY